MIVNSIHLKDSLKQGIHMLAACGFLEEGADGLELYGTEGNAISAVREGQKLSITYDKEAHFYMALARGSVLGDGLHVIEKKASRLGFMMDCSRNAVAMPETARHLLSVLALAGYDYLGLYLEDTYELPGEPYFGYKRGRYSAKELKEIVAAAQVLGLEVVPYIQVLAHLKKLANWKMYFDHMDINDILLVGDEKTYELIGKMLRFCKEIFPTKRIHIGSDEAFCLGRGKYLDAHGYRSSKDIYIEHMKRVFALCREEGLEPEFWADAFYDMEESRPDALKMFDGTQLPVVWHYSAGEAEQLKKDLEKMKSYAGKVMFAGGLWKWMGYVPDNSYSKKCVDILVGTAMDCGVDDILMTAWGDDGNESSVFSVMPSLWYTAQKLYPNDADQSAMLLAFTGYTKEEWELPDRLNHMMPEKTLGNSLNNAAKYLMANDYVIGLMDYNIPDHAGDLYRELLPKLEQLAQRSGQFSYLFASYAALCRVLTRKATYGKRLYGAYQKKDREGMEQLLAELADIREDIIEFRRVYREQWMRENKGFGFEVIDVRLGASISRVDTVTWMVNNYLTGRTEKIYELEEERLEYFSGQLTGDEVYSPLHGLWATAYTVNTLMY